MKKRITIALVLLLVAAALAQRGSGRGKGPEARPATVLGQVLDRDLEVPVEYANIVLYRQRDSTQVNGTVTNENGGFELTVRPGRYYLEVSFIGYRARTVDDIQVAPGARLDIGSVSLRQAVVAVEGAEAVADRPMLTYKIDKKVIEVSQMATTTSGTAVDVLENVPSVEVDIEGNVSLRGSENFTVLVDGRPSILEPSEVLQQIPAGTIENIGIITNPSAKYDPDGVSGIINVVLKKKKVSGISGIFNANVGIGNKYGGDFLLSVRQGILNAFVGADYNKREFGGTRAGEIRTSRGDTTSYVNSDGIMTRDRPSHGVRVGVDLQLGSADRLSFAGRYGGRTMEGATVLDFTEWTVPGDTSFYLSDGVWRRSGDHLSLNLDHQHDFGKNGHNLLAQVSWNSRDAEEESTTELYNDSTRADTLSGWRATESGPRGRLTLKLDYTLPLRESDKLEAGYQSRFRWSEDISKAYEYNPAGDSYEFKPEYSHTTDYTRDIHSLYALYAGSVGNFGFQGGLRGEYTDRAIELLGEDSVFTIDRPDYFPTVHLSYQLPAEQQVMASYTRRLQRPRWWNLEPSLTWFDAYNVRQGNPGLLPEYIDSYEASYQLPIAKNRLSAEAYYRVVHTKTERVRSVYPLKPNVILHSFENVGNAHSLGVETMLNLSPFDWWAINLMGDVYDYRVEGTLQGSDFEQTSFNWRARFGNEFKLPTGTRFQVNGRYHSPSASAQGERKGFLMTDVSVKQEFLNRRLSVTLQVRDVLSTGGHEFTSEGEGFYSHMRFTRESPAVMLNVSYNFNNFRPQRRRPDDDEEEEGGFE
jgi:outer membrane receptor protein involved in Fe transport